MFSEQSRLFVYAIFLSKSTARLLRFEPSVVIASQHWDYLDDPWPLLQFFLRFASSSSRARGFDPTIQPASPAEEKLAHKHLLPWKDSKKLRPVVRIQVPGRTSRDPDRFVLAWHSLCSPTLEVKLLPLPLAIIFLILCRERQLVFIQCWISTHSKFFV
jgi:hypothetical protein